jgi:hypothetical protein
MTLIIEPAPFEFVIAGRRIDQRTVEARRFRTIGGDLQMQLGRDPNGSERIMLMNAATLAMLCERATADLLEGKAVDEENMRRNMTMLGATLVKLGMAAKSRDVTKRDRVGGDEFGIALIEANARQKNC